jgi:DNA repair protein RadC
LQPSQEDIKLTQKLKQAAIQMDINVQDHLIVGENSYYSFVDEGIL